VVLGLVSLLEKLFCQEKDSLEVFPTKLRLLQILLLLQSTLGLIDKKREVNQKKLLCILSEVPSRSPELGNLVRGNTLKIRNLKEFQFPTNF